MYLKYHRRYFPEDVLVYIEEFNKPNGYVIFDFYDSNEFIRFSNTIKDDYDWIENGTMVQLINYNKRTIRENTYYSIKRETINFWIENDSISKNENSFLLGYEIDMTNFELETEVFTHTVSLNDFFETNHLAYSYNGIDNIGDIDIDLNGDLSVIVRNVGQGNWNEIKRNNNFEVVYDCGTSLNAKKSDIRSLISSRSNDYLIDKPCFFLSHWDKDHYHCLVGMTDSELSSFSNFVCRDNLPNLTSRKLFSRISSLLPFNVYPIPADNRTVRGGLTFLRALNPITNRLVIYNSQYHKNRNISGIFLSLKNSKTSVVFSGDSHYSQISTCILPHLNFNHQHYLIVPHHGGKGGTYVYTNPGKIKFESAIISVGPNKYGHPQPYYVSALKSDFRTFNKTSHAKSDITINL
ncbi:beta-lactamase superfamily II metal-dependent hydrolase [Tenacibaculum adriaticum]|uniref:Beta-lactamase superfamily II metal-dependent hydrolase n=1 Tax=Tenacibaculum adriaticum TaxID=413713 RepID=A0A5S5DY93_9FLAO|nr:hypothetical protein [Tenacibaculum adriaticum]TYQ00229.1 beta-lactamase superfamily II metal-dependent hydrolase [Tenacibaculum adriaticum]